ncbi:MAG: precorrin-6A reductase [Lachnospiraceae bacterium]|nr:precorrin-6A reductase [Lachnospiraceae bacterium]
MKKILIYGGTTEGRKLSEILAAHQLHCDVCVATQYGEQVMEPSEYVRVLAGRRDAGEMEQLLEEDYLCVVDATHPYAREVRENIRRSTENKGALYLRLSRETESVDHEGCEFFDSVEDCIEALKKEIVNPDCRIMLTTGSRQLPLFCADEALRQRLVARILPDAVSLQICLENQLEGRQIIAMQGPFTKEVNQALIRQYRCSILVTKDSGRTGGSDAKFEAARAEKIRCFVIRRPQTEGEETGYEAFSFGQILEKLSELTGQEIRAEKPAVRLILAGCGMGGEGALTGEVKAAIRKADFLFGAERMIAAASKREDARSWPYYRADQIFPILEQAREEATGSEEITAVVLFSGDTGFYSGCLKLKAAAEQVSYMTTRVLPGISSISALAARAGVPWQDAGIISTHGIERSRWEARLLEQVKSGHRTFFLSSGAEDIRLVGEILTAHGLEDTRVCLGYQMSYPEEEYRELSPEECRQIHQKGLYTGLLLPAEGHTRRLIPAFRDEDMTRAAVPMTKEEVRELSVCKLHLHENSVVYDIGCGTGSVSMEIAALSPTIQVYAIDDNSEATALTRANRDKLGLPNIEVITGRAPQALEGLPVPTHAFLGGTKGQLKGILEWLYGLNPSMRIVMNTVTLESVGEMAKIPTLVPCASEEIVMVQVGRAHKAGPYHLMQANNPVYIGSFEFEAR